MTTILQPETVPVGLPLLRSGWRPAKVAAGDLGFAPYAPSRRRRLWLLPMVDAACALSLSLALRPVAPVGGSTSASADWAVALLWVTLLASSRAYEFRPMPFGIEGTRQVLNAGLALATAGLVLVSVSDRTLDSRSMLVLSGAVVTASVTHRWIAQLPILTRRRQGQVRVVVAGHRRNVERVLSELRSAGPRHFEPVAVCLSGAGKLTSSDLPAVHGLDMLAMATTQHRADAVIVVPCRHLDPRRVRRLGWELEERGTQLFVAAGLLDVSRTRTHIGYAGALSLLHVRQAELRGGRRLLKHVAERALAGLALVLVAPLLVGIAVLVRAGSEGPALYRQIRIGKNGTSFSIFKFRTMTTDADTRRADLQATDADGTVLFKMRNDPRVTHEGRLLRRYSLDELPQLLNVVRGEMSLVGPRPPLPAEVAQYEPDAHRRLAVTPGITGLWQVSGRSDLSWEESLRLDLRYVDNWSLGLDTRILCRTVRAVLGHRGAY